MSELTYTPSTVARLARIIIPILRKVLPAGLYKLVYDALYNGYKALVRKSYIFNYIAARLSGNKNRITRATLTKELLPYTMGGRKALENAYDMVKLVEDRGVDGVLVECGVAEGGTAAMLAMANKKLGKAERTKWFFDSYEGLPEPTQEDYVKGKAGEFIRPLPPGSCLGTIEQVSELMFDTLKFQRDKINLVKGWFQDTVPPKSGQLGNIAILRLDGDWYESTKIPLDAFYSQIPQGGVVIIDDYATCFGSSKATDEFRKENNITTPLVPDGRGGVWFEKG